MDSNFRFRATASSVIAIRGCTPENRFASDSLLEGDGFEISVRGHGESANPRYRFFFVLPARFGRVPTEHQTPPRDEGARAYDITA